VVTDFEKNGSHMGEDIFFWRNDDMWHHDWSN
jgi:hypothetical protein